MTLSVTFDEAVFFFQKAKGVLPTKFGLEYRATRDNHVIRGR